MTLKRPMRQTFEAYTCVASTYGRDTLKEAPVGVVVTNTAPDTLQMALALFCRVLLISSPAWVCRPWSRAVAARASFGVGCRDTFGASLNCLLLRVAASLDLVRR